MLASWVSKRHHLSNCRAIMLAVDSQPTKICLFHIKLVDCWLMVASWWLYKATGLFNQFTTDNGAQVVQFKPILVSLIMLLMLTIIITMIFERGIVVFQIFEVDSMVKKTGGVQLFLKTKRWIDRWLSKCKFGRLLKLLWFVVN